MLRPEQRRFLEGLLAQTRDLAALPGDDPEDRRARALALRRVGLILLILGRPREAVDASADAVTRLERLRIEGTSLPGLARALTDALQELAAAHAGLGDHPLAEAAQRRAVAYLEEERTTRPADRELRIELARALSSAGYIVLEQGRGEEADEDYRRALAVLEEVSESERDDVHHLTEATVRSGRGLPLSDRRPREAEAEYRRAIDLLVGYGGGDPEPLILLPGARVGLARVLCRQRRWTEAESLARQAVEALDRLAAEYPGLAFVREQHADARNALGTALSGLGRWKDARASYASALDSYTRLLRDFPDNVAYRIELAGVRVNLGHIARREGSLDEAERLYQQAEDALLTLVARTVPADRARVYLRNACTGKVQVLAAGGRFCEAAVVFQWLAELDDPPRRLAYRLQRMQFLARAGLAAVSADLAETLAAEAGPAADRQRLLAWAVTTVPLTLEGVPDTERARFRAVALTALKRAVAAGAFAEPQQKANLADSPEWQPLRADPDFRELLKAVQAGD